MRKRVLCIIMVMAALLCALTGCSGEKKIIICGKQYTEAILTSEIMAQLIESQTDIKVERTYNMASALCFESVKNGDADMYPEYTGGMLMAYLSEEVEPGTSPQETYDRAKKGFKEQFDLVVLESMGFNNTYSNAISRELSEEYGIKTFSDLVPYTSELTYGAEHAFYDRSDGYFNMCEMYGFEFKSYFKMDVALKYASLEQNQIDVINAYTTDGLLSEYDLVMLEDDLHFFPAYYCCPVIRQSTLDKYPEIATVLAPLKDCCTEEDMIRYNHLVDTEVMTIEAAAAEFIKEKNLLG